MGKWGSGQVEESSSLTRTKDENQRWPRSLTGGYDWFPAKVGDTVEWSVLSCHDLGFGPDRRIREVSSGLDAL